MYSHKYSNFTLARSANCGPGIDSVSTDLILKYFRKVQDYETTYSERKKDGKELEKAIKF